MNIFTKTAELVDTNSTEIAQARAEFDSAMARGDADTMARVAKYAPYRAAVASDARKQAEDWVSRQLTAPASILALLAVDSEVSRTQYKIAKAYRTRLEARVTDLQSRLDRAEQKLSAATKEIGALTRRAQSPGK